MNELGELLRSLRGKKSLREAAEKAGISHNYLSIVEKGTDPRSGSPVKPTPETLMSLSKAYNYSYEELMKVAGYLSDEGAEEKKEINHEAVTDLIDFLNDPNSKINGSPIPQSFIDDILGYVRTRTAMDMGKNKPQ